ncbi:MAG: hypothetical protein A2Y34_07530 [Spirochaetes bacterium GWC1_27_15]|nr:MAG: hypothetical protein A2Y34_07530 [Spirochaetes bacterium GWC1_27_15]
MDHTKYITQQINSLRNDIIEVSGLVRNMLTIIDQNLKTHTKIPFNDLLKVNKRVEKIYFLIKEENLDIIAELKLADADIRLIIGGTKLILNYLYISNKLISISKNERLDFSNYNIVFIKMIGIIIDMFDKLFIAFTYREIDKCYEVIADDKNLDDIKNEKYSIIIEEMMKNESLVPIGIELIELISSMERIGDYLKNISENIVYIFTAKNLTFKTS